ncbi:MAG TPA: Ig-like domain-containing protein [Gemmatimonadaceae bacterium]|nr:Ig-like domain-containing protein [Gemmatimonadaceae bacterium]
MTQVLKATSAAKSAGRILVASVSSAAALVSVLSFMRTYGMIGQTASHMTVGDIGAAWVGVSPTTDTVTAIGDTIHLAATVTDKSGSVLVGSSLVWSSENPRVASVETDGTVIARGSGSTVILATVGDKIARSRVTVKQSVSSVRVNGDSTITISDGEQAPLAARAIDARGHVIPQRPVIWQSANTDVISIDTLGIATAKNPGSTTVGATIDGVTSYVPAKVVAVPAALELVAGGEQRAPAGAALPQKLVIRVLSKRARAVGNTSVRFRAEDGAGTPEPSVATTDGDGRVRAAWTLGSLPGRQRLYVSVDHVDSALVVVAEAEPVAANTRAAQIGDVPSATAGTPLGSGIGLRLTDSTGRALADIPLTWVALDGGSITGAAQRTDSVGEARAKWTLGTTAGTQRIRVQIGSGRAVPPVTLKAIATSGAPAKIQIASGDEQRATVNAALRQPIVVRVVDKLGNPVPGAKVQWTAANGTLPGTLEATDSSGTVSSRWTMPREAGKAKLTVKVEGLDQQAELSATAVPASAANLTLTSDATGGVAGKALSDPVVATVTDSYGNPVADAQLVFTAKSGSTSPSRIVTDTKGHAQTRWTLGKSAGEQALVAVVKGHDVRGTLTVQATEPTTRSVSKKTTSSVSKSSSTKKKHR